MKSLAISNIEKNIHSTFGLAKVASCILCVHLFLTWSKGGIGQLNLFLGPGALSPTFDYTKRDPTTPSRKFGPSTWTVKKSTGLYLDKTSNTVTLCDDLSSPEIMCIFLAAYPLKWRRCAS